MAATTSSYTSDALPSETVDTVVIGGGAAGPNGALTLARSRRSVVVIDSGTRAAPSPECAWPTARSRPGASSRSPRGRRPAPRAWEV
ncbi:FAD-binding protein [Nonomuraea sp. NPDC050153]|uniref:FAD-binding protein n=1 Tax=Nonomuraea sp. NPDC050153 TaxID=3364359 RepID=UPI0037BE2041